MHRHLVILLIYILASFQVIAQDVTPPIITVNTTPHVGFGQGMSFYVNIIDSESLITSVTAEYRSISAGGAFKTLGLIKISANFNDYSNTIDATEFGPLGLEYKISATSAGGTNTTALRSTRIIVESPGLPIPYSAFGNEISNFRIVSVPLELLTLIDETNNNVSDLFDELLPLNDKKWRLFHYSETNTPKKTKVWDSQSPILPGWGYWLIISNDPKKTILSGRGKTVFTSSDAPFEIQLKKGFNQIGNPYPFDLVWSDVQDLNPGLSSLTIFDGNPDYQTSNTLKKMEGGFVKVDSDMKLKFPVKRNPSTGGRTNGNDSPVINELTATSWEVPLWVHQGDRVNRISGFGMNEKASDRFDRYDGFNLPRFFDTYLELNHTKKEGEDSYSKDIVMSAAQHVWEFNVESSLEDKIIQLKWDNTHFGNNEKELYLWDARQQRAVNMRSVNSYSFDKKNATSFQVIYGPSEFIKEKTSVKEVVFHAPFPNPAEEELTISFTLPKELANPEVHFEMTDMMGRKCWSDQKSFSEGYHEVTWKRNAAAGIYFITLKSGTVIKQAKVVFK